MNTIGHQLKKIRLNREWEIEKVAILSGLSPETVIAIEEDEIDVQVSTLAKLSDALKCAFLVGDMSI